MDIPHLIGLSPHIIPPIAAAFKSTFREALTTTASYVSCSIPLISLTSLGMPSHKRWLRHILLKPMRPWYQPNSLQQLPLILTLNALDLTRPRQFPFGLNPCDLPHHIAGEIIPDLRQHPRAITQPLNSH